jgi:hypothetical protein
MTYCIHGILCSWYWLCLVDNSYGLCNCFEVNSIFANWNLLEVNMGHIMLWCWYKNYGVGGFSFQIGKVEVTCWI